MYSNWNWAISLLTTSFCCIKPRLPDCYMAPLEQHSKQDLPLFCKTGLAENVMNVWILTADLNHVFVWLFHFQTTVSLCWLTSIKCQCLKSVSPSTCFTLEFTSETNGSLQRLKSGKKKSLMCHFQTLQFTFSAYSTESFRDLTNCFLVWGQLKKKKKIQQIPLTVQPIEYTATGLLVHLVIWPLSPVAVPLEVEPQLEDPVSKLTAEAVSVWVLPLPVHDLKGNVLIRRACVEP